MLLPVIAAFVLDLSFFILFIIFITIMLMSVKLIIVVLIAMMKLTLYSCLSAVRCDGVKIVIVFFYFFIS
jgi:hypothetical protein